MAYTPPYIDDAGLHIPTYNEIKTFLLDEARGIFGEDIYLENDSQDYQYLILSADRIHDVFQAVQLIYNNRGPSTAIRGALNALVKLNGIARKRATHSTATVTLTGNPNTVINNGVVADEGNHNWDLPTPITIPLAGTIDVIATCQEAGAIFATPGTINRIVNPTIGWVSVSNAEPATAGQTVEEWEALRARQTISTARPSKTVLEGLIGGVAEILDVTRQMVYENDTNVDGPHNLQPRPIPWPIPAHHISVVAEGGTDEDIANEIYLRKTPGCGTYGDVTVEIPSGNVIGMQLITPISFFRPTYYDIWVTHYIRRLHGFTSETEENIITNTVDYLNSLSIGDNLTMSALWGAAIAAMPSIIRPSFSITSVTAGLDETSQEAADIEVPFNCVTRGYALRVKVEFVN